MKLVGIFTKKRTIFFLTSVVSVLVFFIVIVFWNIKTETREYIYEDIERVPTTQTAVVPGAAILPSGALSSVLKERADGAVALYWAGKVDKILVTGDNSTLLYNEVNPVRDYLVRKGIPDQDIFLDHAGFDTYSSMYRARDIFSVTSITIITQSFHLPRAVYIARRLGIQAYGFQVDHGEYRMRNYIREWFANVKAVLNLFSNRKPKFLGEVIPITGDGRENP